MTLKASGRPAFLKYATATLFTCMIASVALFISACGEDASGGLLTSTSSATNDHPTTVLPVTTMTTSTTLPTLSPRQMAGQRVIYSYSGLTPPPALISLISRGEAAGVIFFASNISTEAQTRSVIETLNEAAASPENPIEAPLLLMVDQEGGQVRRLPGEPLLSQKQIGLSADPVAQAAEAGEAAGRNLRRLGMNVNLAPVLDVYREEGGFNDQYGRSYSDDPAVVSELGVAFIEAQQRIGVAATAKHFPGLGAATRSENTDLQPVTLSIARTSLLTIDEYPYESAIRAGIELVMLSWATYPAFDPELPAGLSPTIVQGELRERLGFEGVTITDALGAGALESYGADGRRAVLAAEAGVDLILCASGDVSLGQEAMEAIETAYRDGTLDKSAFEASLQRILALRFSLAERPSD